MDNNIHNHLPPIIYVADSPEVAKNYKWDSCSKKLDKNVAILVPEDIIKLDEGNDRFYLPYDITPGEVLVRHPYNEGYILATDAEEEYLSASAEGIFLIARCLGATSITYKKSKLAEFKREVDSENGLTYKAVEVSLNIKNELEEKLLNKHTMTREFPKVEFTAEQFAKAKAIAEERGLMYSRDIRSLLDARDPELGAPMSHQTINVDLSSSLNKALDIAFTLNVVPLFKLNSNTKIATQKKLEVHIEWDIVF